MVEGEFKVAQMGKLGEEELKKMDLPKLVEILYIMLNKKQNPESVEIPSEYYEQYGKRDGKEVVDFILSEGDFIDLPDHDLNVVMEMRTRLAKILSLIDEEDFVFAKVLIEDMDRDIKKDYRLDYVYGPQLVYAQGLIGFLEGE